MDSTRVRTSSGGSPRLGRTFGSTLISVPGSAAAKASSTSEAPGSRTIASEPVCSRRTEPGRKGPGFQSRVKVYCAPPSASSTARAVEVLAGGVVAGTRSPTPAPVRWAWSAAPCASAPRVVSSSVRTPSRASPTATFAGLPPGREVTSPSAASTSSISASPTTRAVGALMRSGSGSRRPPRRRGRSAGRSGRARRRARPRRRNDPPPGRW